MIVRFALSNAKPQFVFHAHPSLWSQLLSRAATEQVSASGIACTPIFRVCLSRVSVDRRSYVDEPIFIRHSLAHQHSRLRAFTGDPGPTDLALEAGLPLEHLLRRAAVGARAFYQVAREPPLECRWRQQGNRQREEHQAVDGSKDPHPRARGEEGDEKHRRHKLAEIKTAISTHNWSAMTSRARRGRRSQRRAASGLYTLMVLCTGG
mmetsp:Transcript_55384/g.120685  ORF Transcript_55384/g.120685 Transcript_55384/m.120685 type:complete len:207 (-) Transcript_55384:535-1155(-)